MKKKRKCPICKEEFTPKHPNQKYCKPECRIIARKRQIAYNVARHRQKYRNSKKEARYTAIGEATKEHGKAAIEHYHTGKGTSRLGPKPLPDFNAEQEKIHKEFRRLRIKAPSLN